MDYYGSGNRIRRILKSRGEYFLKKIILGVGYSIKNLDNLEIECIKFFQSNNDLYGYNISRGGKGTTYIRTPEIREKNRLAVLGRKHTEEAKRKLSNKLKGRKLSKEAIEKRIRTITGRNLSEETKEKIRKALKGKTYEEIYGDERAIKQKEKLSKAHIGNKNKIKGKTYEETYGIEQAEYIKKNISKNRKGKNCVPCSENTKIKISKANMGNKYRRKDYWILKERGEL